MPEEKTRKPPDAAEILEEARRKAEVKVALGDSPEHVPNVPGIKGKFVFSDSGLLVPERSAGEAAGVRNREADLEIVNTVLRNFTTDSLGNNLAVVYGFLHLEAASNPSDHLRKAMEHLKELISGVNAYKSFIKPGEPTLGGITDVSVRDVLEPMLSGQPLKNYLGEEFPIPPEVNMRFVYDPAIKGALRMEELPKVRGSEKAVRLALQETLINAVESMGVEGMKWKDSIDVRVYARREGGRLVIDVLDAGRGMSEEEVSLCQLPFYKVPNTKTSERFGLGAFIALQSAKYCSGDIVVGSRMGVGTKASVSFPIAFSGD